MGKNDNGSVRDDRNDIEKGEEYDLDIYTLTGEEGEELQFYLLGTLEDRGMVYKAFLPVDSKDDDEYVILRYYVDENGDDYVETIEDDEEFDRVSDIFNDELSDILYDDSESDE